MVSVSVLKLLRQWPIGVLAPPPSPEFLDFSDANIVHKFAGGLPLRGRHICKTERVLSFLHYQCRDNGT